MLSSSQELKLKPMSHRPAALEASLDILRFEDQTSVLRCFVKAMRFAQCCAVAHLSTAARKPRRLGDLSETALHAINPTGRQHVQSEILSLRRLWQISSGQ